MTDEHREYNGVDMDHPSIVNAVQNMIRRGEGKEKIMKVVGCPGEIVDKHKIIVEREEKK